MSNMSKQHLNKNDKPPRRWGWFVLLYVSSLLVMAGISGLLEFIVNRLQ